MIDGQKVGLRLILVSRVDHARRDQRRGHLTRYRRGREVREHPPAVSDT